MRTEPVKYSVGPLRDGCEPFRVISIVAFLGWAVGVSEAAGLAATIAARPLEAKELFSDRHADSFTILFVADVLHPVDVLAVE